jgi:UDP-glucose 4-epimerase
LTRPLPRRIAVTGGAGFIGSHTVDALVARECEVLVLDDLSHDCGVSLSAQADLLAVDCGSEAAAEALQRFRPDAVLHLAARGGVNRAMRDPGTHVRTAVASSVALFKAATDAGARAVITASSGGAVYGDAATLPAPERLTPAPRSAYGASKAAEEVYLASFRHLTGARTLALRYGNVYGPRQDGTGEAGVVAISCTKLIAGAAPVIRGDGLQTRDFVFVLDVVAANLAALRSGRSGAVNVGTGRETSVRTVVDTLCRLDGGAHTPRHDPPVAGEVRRGCLDAQRAQRWLGWHAATTIEDGLRDTLAWFRSTATAPADAPATAHAAPQPVSPLAAPGAPA